MKVPSSCSRLVRRYLPLLLVWLTAVSVGLSGCGRIIGAKTRAPTHARVVQQAPTYRVGQYCFTSKKARYRSVGLTCTHHHLYKR